MHKAKIQSCTVKTAKTFRMNISEMRERIGRRKSDKNSSAKTKTI